MRDGLYAEGNNDVDSSFKTFATTRPTDYVADAVGKNPLRRLVTRACGGRLHLAQQTKSLPALDQLRVAIPDSALNTASRKTGRLS